AGDALRVGLDLCDVYRSSHRRHSVAVEPGNSRFTFRTKAPRPRYAAPRRTASPPGRGPAAAMEAQRWLKSRHNRRNLGNVRLDWLCRPRSARRHSRYANTRFGDGRKDTGVKNGIVVAAFAMLLALSPMGDTASAADKHLHWVGTWGASPDSTDLSF